MDRMERSNVVFCQMCRKSFHNNLLARWSPHTRISVITRAATATATFAATVIAWRAVAFAVSVSVGIAASAR